MDNPHRVVIIGGGFGGLHAARALRRAPVRVTLLDRRNFHLFQPLLYQVATGGLSPANIASPLRSILKRQANTEVLMAEVTDIDVAGKRVLFRDGSVGYDTLIVATGAGHHYFGHKDWEKYAPSLKTVEDATEIRRRILVAFETAERESDAERRRAWLTFVVVGGGPTGVELAGALGELAHYTLRREFRSIDPSSARILLVEGLDRVLPTYPPKLSAKAAASLARLGVTVRTSTVVTDLGPESVTVRSGDGTERIAAHTVVWAAGVQASPLAQTLARASGTAPDRACRVVVQPDCSLPGHPELFVIGDMANFSHPSGKPLPGVAQVAIQQGRYVARLVQLRLRGETLPPFHYKDYGNLATIGGAAAVADLGWVRFSGYPAWLFWLFIHLMNLVAFENRLLVLVQWAWNYFTRNRSARLVTGREAPPAVTATPAYGPDP
ncbi:MAG TPA: NAD(P)/FAD-dependent oxidoreductase [Gemmataceae bacterium]|nr:NAD(P)/FAD-dependent oxidoreductase [Gemmataceae bacterium]